MSVFGGDSWGREAQNRKRRIDHLIIEGTKLDHGSYKKLSNGGFTCLICRHRPIFDTPLMLSMHCKGSRHRNAESQLKERELRNRDEINKRIALSDSLDGTPKTSKISSIPCLKLGSKPLIEQTRKSALEVLGKGTPQMHPERPKSHEVQLTRSALIAAEPLKSNDVKSAAQVVSLQHPDYLERREKELKFTSAGWKRDGHGRWYKDENVEFDSDEEDPNICLT